MAESATTNGMVFDDKQLAGDKKIALNVRRRLVSPACIAGVRISRPNEVVIVAQQVEVLLEPLLGACVAECPSYEVGRALPDGQVQPLDERRV